MLLSPSSSTTQNVQKSSVPEMLWKISLCFLALCFDLSLVFAHFNTTKGPHGAHGIGPVVRCPICNASFHQEGTESATTPATLRPPFNPQVVVIQMPGLGDFYPPLPGNVGSPNRFAPKPTKSRFSIVTGDPDIPPELFQGHHDDEPPKFFFVPTYNISRPTTTTSSRNPYQNERSPFGLGTLFISPPIGGGPLPPQGHQGPPPEGPPPQGPPPFINPSKTYVRPPNFRGRGGRGPAMTPAEYAKFLKELIASQRQKEQGTGTPITSTTPLPMKYESRFRF